MEDNYIGFDKKTHTISRPHYKKLKEKLIFEAEDDDVIEDGNDISIEDSTAAETDNTPTDDSSVDHLTAAATIQGFYDDAFRLYSNIKGNVFEWNADAYDSNTREVLNSVMDDVGAAIGKLLTCLGETATIDDASSSSVEQGKEEAEEIYSEGTDLTA